MRVLFVTSEIATIYKRGGLADVSYSLPLALTARGVDVAVVMPYYESIPVHNVKCIGQLAIDFDRRRELVFVFETVLPGTHVPVFLFRHPLINRYDDPHIVERFSFFSKAVAQLYLYSPHIFGEAFDIIHCNDWHTALLPLMVGEHRKIGFRERETMQSAGVRTILTIHNLLYQGEAGVSMTLKLGFPKSIFHPFTTPLGKAIRLLTEGMECADRVTTVSPTYAREIMKGVHGDRVKDIFKRRNDRITGILNGIDQGLWDPKTDTFLPTHYDKKTVVEKKKSIKSHLQKALRLPQSNVPLFGFVGRIEPRQKGLDLVARAIKALPQESYQIALLGTGSETVVKQFIRLAKKHPNVSFSHTFDERLARRIYAGSDVMLVPSKFEPCGLTQMIAMRYGTVPLVRKTGGLADTVRDGKTGFVFDKYNGPAFIRAMERVIKIFELQPEVFSDIIKRVMAQDFSWKKQAGKYVELYRSMCASH